MSSDASLGRLSTSAAATSATGTAAPAAAGSAALPRSPGTATGPARSRRARLVLARVDPWSVLKISFFFSLAFGVMLIVAAWVIWNVLNGLGVFNAVGTTVNETLNKNIGSYVSMATVMGYTIVFALLDVVILTLLATLGAFLYNLLAALLGGVDVTLADSG